MRLRLPFFALPLVIFCLLTGSIGCDSAGSGADGETGRLRLFLTDAPFPFELVDSTNVILTRVELVPKADSLERIVLSDDTLMFNLLDLQGGITAAVADTMLPVGSYSQLRLFVHDARIVLVDESEFDLAIPSGAQSGLKILLNDLPIAPDSLTELTLDFDVAESFVVQGNPDTPAGIKGFTFKPVIKPLGFSIPEE